MRNKLDNQGLQMPAIGALQAYRLRLKRRRLLWRSLRSRHHLRIQVDHTADIRPDTVLCVCVLRNEIKRLPFFLKHHRALGVGQFLIVDNGSDDGSFEYLLDQPDVSLWQTHHSYRDARFGLDWLTWLQFRYAHNKWVLMADVDELLIYDGYQTRGLRDLTKLLELQGRSAFGTLMLDLYPKGSVESHNYEAGQDPVEILTHFDAKPYRATRQAPLGNLWVQGGARERMFFADEPERSPTLNKIPFVKWSRRFAYVNSCHSALPRRLNACYDGPEGDQLSGVMLHTKFLPEIVSKSAIEKARGQHFNDPSKFDDYYDAVSTAPDLWCEESVRYAGDKQLVDLNLMARLPWNDL